MTKLLERVARGEEIVTTRHEKPIARIVPEGRGKFDKVRDVVAGLRELRGKIAVRLGREAKLSSKDQILD